MSSAHNPSGAEATILYDNYVNTIVDDDLASGVVRPSTGIALIKNHILAIDLHEEEFQLSILPFKLSIV